MKKRCFNVMVLLTALVSLPVAAYAQSSDDTAPTSERPLVVSAVAPPYPRFSLPNTSGGVMAEVIIDARGQVVDAKALNGHPLLHGPSMEAAKLWRFAPAGGSGNRRARLFFEYRILPAGSPQSELWPIYKPPYRIEVKKLPDNPRGARRR